MKLRSGLIGLILLSNSFPVFSQTLERYALREIRSSFRGLSVVTDSVAWVSGNNGWVGRTTNRGQHWEFTQVPGFESLDFRSLYAFNDSVALLVNAGSPAYILRTTTGGKSWQVVYTNSASAIFIDGVDFWNDKEGVLYGDPIDGRMFLLFTKDGGHTWNEPPLETRPALAEGEASFAASGTGIRCYDKNRLVITTGGKTSRLFFSDNRGKTWRTSTPPVQQGNESSGAFSVAFQNLKTGIVVGGNFAIDTLRIKNMFYTSNAGKTWKEAETSPKGYRECVEYVAADTWITTGPTGTEYSTDGGNNWMHLSGDRGFHVVRKARKGNWIVIAGNSILGAVHLK